MRLSYMKIGSEVFCCSAVNIEKKDKEQNENCLSKLVFFFITGYVSTSAHFSIIELETSDTTCLSYLALSICLGGRSVTALLDF